MNRLSIEARAQTLVALSEGVRITAACRMSGASKNTAIKVIADVGEACSPCQDRAMRNLRCTQNQADEIWSFVGMKQKNIPPIKPLACGSATCTPSLPVIRSRS